MAVDYRKFSAELKKRHPKLSKFDDRMLVERIVARRPDLRERISFEDEREPSFLDKASQFASLVPMAFKESVKQAKDSLLPALTQDMSTTMIGRSLEQSAEQADIPFLSGKAEEYAKVPLRVGGHLVDVVSQPPNLAIAGLLASAPQVGIPLLLARAGGAYFGTEMLRPAVGMAGRGLGLGGPNFDAMFPKGDLEERFSGGPVPLPDIMAESGKMVATGLMGSMALRHGLGLESVKVGAGKPRQMTREEGKYFTEQQLREGAPEAVRSERLGLPAPGQEVRSPIRLGPTEADEIRLKLPGILESRFLRALREREAEDFPSQVEKYLPPAERGSRSLPSQPQQPILSISDVGSLRTSLMDRFGEVRRGERRGGAVAGQPVLGRQQETVPVLPEIPKTPPAPVLSQAVEKRISDISDNIARVGMNRENLFNEGVRRYAEVLAESGREAADKLLDSTEKKAVNFLKERGLKYTKSESNTVAEKLPKPDWWNKPIQSIKELEKRIEEYKKWRDSGGEKETGRMSPLESLAVNMDTFSQFRHALKHNKALQSELEASGKNSLQFFREVREERGLDASADVGVSFSPLTFFFREGREFLKRTGEERSIKREKFLQSLKNVTAQQKEAAAKAWESFQAVRELATKSSDYFDFRTKLAQNAALRDSVKDFDINYKAIFDEAKSGKPPSFDSVAKGEPFKTGPIEPAILEVIDAIRSVKPLRREYEKIKRETLKRKVGAASAVGRKTEGEKGFYSELSQFKGDVPKVLFESVRGKLSQEKIDYLFEYVKNNPKLSYFESINARMALSKMFGREYGGLPTPSELALLDRVFPKEMVDALLEKRHTLEKWTDIAVEVANIPKALLATFDLSAPFRQGVFFATRPEFYPALKNMFKVAFSEKNFKALQEEIASRPTYELMQDSKLGLTEMGRDLMKREELYVSRILEKVPGLSNVLKASNRGYVGFLNKLRADVFDNLYNSAKAAGREPDKNPELMYEITRFINAATGRGNMGAFERHGKLLSAALFSPRLIASRMTLLNPFYYIAADKFVRKEALKSLFGYAAFLLTMNGLAKMAGADITVDPLNADFIKPKFGTTRVDVGGGFSQYIRLASALISGKIVSSTTGKVMTMGEGFRPLRRTDMLLRFGEGKLNPILSFAVGMVRGTTGIGEEFKMFPSDFSKGGRPDFKDAKSGEIIQRFIPLVIQDTIEVTRDLGPAGLSLVPLASLGFGLQSYGKPITPAAKAIFRKQSEIFTSRFAAAEDAKTSIREYMRDPSPETRRGMIQNLSRLESSRRKEILKSTLKRYGEESKEKVASFDAFRSLNKRERRDFLRTASPELLKQFQQEILSR